MRYICLAFALTSFFMSLVVYGQVAQVNHDSCLLIDFRSPVAAKTTLKNTIKSPTKTLKSLLNYANIPLEISYIKSDKQFDSFAQFLAFLSPRAEQQEQVLAENTINNTIVEEPKIVEAVKIISEPINDNSLKVALEAQTQNNYEEKPVLRMPNE